MKSVNKYNIILASIFLAVSCGSGGNSAISPVSGTIKNGGSGNQLILEHLTPTAVKVVDTAVIDEDGHFAFVKVKIDEIGFYRVKKNDRNFVTIIVAPTEKVTIESDGELGASPYAISGSAESLRLQELNYRMSKLYMARDSMNYLYEKNQGNEDFLMNIQEEFAILTRENTEFAKEFIKKDPSSLACLAAAEQLDLENEIELLQLIDVSMGKKHPESVYYKEFHKMVTAHLALATGAEAPDIILPDAEGNLTKLSSLRGKVVLVDFWASWCRPCRMENPNVVKAYQKYKAKGFEVFGVSLDQSREKWLEAIDADNLHWTQVSDLQFWSSSVVKLYDIKGIPFAVLLDKEGKIIAKNLRGEELEAKLQEILN